MIDPRPSSFSRALARRALALFAGTVTLALAATPAWSQATRPRDEQACQATLKDAKAKEQDGALQAAKALLRTCAMNPCSMFVRQQCANRYNKLDMDTPTVVLVVTDAAGAARSDVQVRVDGEPFAAKIEGSALPIDPGMHDFSFIVDGHVFATQKILIVQGQRNRFITATIGRGGRGAVASEDAAAPAADEETAKAPVRRRKARKAEAEADKVPAAETSAKAEASANDTKSAEETAPPKPRRILPWVLTGVGAAALGAGAVITIWGRNDNNNLSACSPNCADSTLQHIRKVYQGADIAIGVGVAALAAAYWSYAYSSGTAAESKGSETALRFDVAPTTSGGFAAVSGRF
jgi:hypothetical protein